MLGAHTAQYLVGRSWWRRVSEWQTYGAWWDWEKALVGGSYQDQDWESAGGVCKMPRTSNIRAVLLRDTPKLTEFGLRYCVNERSIAFVDDGRTSNESRR
jgi:hypothetical protein